MGVFAGSHERRGTHLLRVSVIDLVAEIVAPKDHDEAVFANRLDERFHPGNLDRLQLLAHSHAALGAGSACAAVGDKTLGVNAAEIATCRYVAGPHVKVNAERLQYAATDAVFERVIAEETQVARTASRRDARQNGNGEAAHPLANAGVEIGSARRFKLGFAAQFLGQAAETVRDQQDDLRAVILTKFAHELMHFHEGSLAEEWLPVQVPAFDFATMSTWTWT